MMKKIFLTVLALLLSGGTILSAQDMPRGRRNGNRRQFNAAEWEAVQKKLKEKDPESYKKIVELAQTNIFAAADQLRSAAQKNNISMPGRAGRSREGGMPPMMGGPREDGMPPMMGGFRRSDRGNEARKSALESIKAKDPAGYAAYEKLVKQAESNRKQLISVQIEAEKKLSALSAKTRSDVPETLQSYMLKVQYLQEKYDFLRTLGREERSVKLKELAAKEGFTLTELQFRRTREEHRRDAAGRSDPMALMRAIRAKYPEEMRKINELRKTDPEAANAEFRKLLEKVKNDGKH